MGEGKLSSKAGTPKISVRPLEDGWTVAVGGGYYTMPLEKEHALERAMNHALEVGAAEIFVMNETGQLIETLQVAAKKDEAP